MSIFNKAVRTIRAREAFDKAFADNQRKPDEQWNEAAATRLAGFVAQLGLPKQFTVEISQNGREAQITFNTTVVAELKFGWVDAPPRYDSDQIRYEKDWHAKSAGYIVLGDRWLNFQIASDRDQQMLAEFLLTYLATDFDPEKPDAREVKR